MRKEIKIKVHDLFFTILLFPFIIFLIGCVQQGYSVIAATGTIIGVEISQNPTTQAPQAKLGYNRTEFAVVPTNRNSGEEAGDTLQGARDSPNVIMELKYSGIFDPGTDGGIYQRLAIGDLAVKQAGAAAMFLKNANGKVDANTAMALQALASIPAPDPAILKAKSPIVAKFNSLYNKNPNDPVLKQFNTAAKDEGYPVTTIPYKDYPAFRDFSIDTNATINVVNKIKSALEKQSITFP